MTPTPTLATATAGFDKIEHEFGIASYLSLENQGFAAVLKARFSDFLVHEGKRMTTE